MEYEYNEKLKKKACNELEEYGNKSKLSYEDWKVVHLLEDTVKNINKNKMLEESEEEYSEARGGIGRSYMHGSSYDDDMMYSERRGRGRNARRDSMGRYSSEGGSSYEDYPEDRMDGRYSKDDAKDHLMDKLGEAMRTADPNEREILKEAMRKIERA
jgi:hypothetical protein